jgi:hypothetical protein
MATLQESLPQDILDGLPEGFRIDVANLSESGQQEVVDAVTAAHDEGDLADFDFNHAVSDGQTADAARENVEALHEEQAKAVADGDLAKADDLAHQTEYELKEVQDHGGDADTQLVQTEADQAHLEWAEFHADTAHEAAEAAAADYAAGDTAHGDANADIAANHGVVAAEDAHLADQGGVSGDHGYDAAASTGADASVADASASAE